MATFPDSIPIPLIECALDLRFGSEINYNTKSHCGEHSDPNTGFDVDSGVMQLVLDSVLAEYLILFYLQAAHVSCISLMGR